MSGNNKKEVTISVSEIVGFLEQQILDDTITEDEFELYNTYRRKDSFSKLDDKNKITLNKLKIKYTRHYKK